MQRLSFHQQLNSALTNARAVVKNLDSVRREVQRRLARMSGLLPPPPKMMSPRQVNLGEVTQSTIAEPPANRPSWNQRQLHDS